jgi:hypothetical protein
MLGQCEPVFLGWLGRLGKPPVEQFVAQSEIIYSEELLNPS